MIDESAPFVAGSDTSQAAAQSMAGNLSHLRGLVLDHVRHAGDQGATCDQIEVALGMLHQTASARVRELAQTLRLHDSGARRPTRTGRMATVWRT